MDFIQYIRWRPTIGDPSFMGWLTVAAYALVAAIAFATARRATGLAGGNRLIWHAIAALMVLLCLNKQLDLQSLFTDIGRVFAWKQGWYQERREFQKWLVLGILAASSLGTLFLIVRFRWFWKQHFLLASGLVFLLAFIVVRAVSFHHVDVFLGSRLAGVKINWLLELGGISLIGLAAILDYRKSRRSPKPPWKPAA
ncbi:MAG: hypothetical protein Q8Q59_08695 [Luteolibacter sp.]|jgi:hypothetical protein|nr:hypothetical protein [Luteolibacter sp.]